MQYLSINQLTFKNLQGSGLRIKLPANTFYRIGIIRHYQKEADTWNKITLILAGVSKASYYSYKKRDFKLSDYQKKQHKNSRTDRVICDIIDSNANKTGKKVSVTYQDLENVNIISKQLALLNPQKIEECRVEEQAQIEYIESLPYPKIEKLANEIFTKMASGRVTLSEACGRFGVSTDLFVEWIRMYPELQEMLMEAKSYRHEILKDELWMGAVRQALKEAKTGNITRVHHRWKKRIGKNDEISWEAISKDTFEDPKPSKDIAATYRMLFGDEMANELPKIEYSNLTDEELDTEIDRLKNGGL